MKYKDFKFKVLESLIDYKEKELKIFKDGVWRNNTYKHILPKDYEDKNFLLDEVQNYVKSNKISMHHGSSHLNSSQVMCINFFQPLIHHNLLKEFLKIINIDFFNVNIESFGFEHIENLLEGTNFDFYIKMKNGERIFFEIKYTEDGFGRAKNDSSHKNKIQHVYDKMAKNSKYFKSGITDQEDFLKNYQIYRNLMYIQNEKDYVVFIYPFDNDNLHVQLKNILSENKYPNAINLDWKKICLDIINYAKENKELSDYYTEFQRKYINY